MFPVCLFLARAALHDVLHTNQSPMWSPNSKPRTLPPLLNLGSGQYKVGLGIQLSSRVEVKVECINCFIAAICDDDDTPCTITYSSL